MMLSKKPGFRQNSMELRNAVETNNTGDKEVGNHNHLNEYKDLIFLHKIDSKFLSRIRDTTSMTTPITPRVDREEVPSRVAPGIIICLLCYNFKKIELAPNKTC